MSNSRRLQVEPDPDVADFAPTADGITAYDEQHLITYLRLLDAQEGGADWREVSRIVLHREASKEPARTKQCYESHLARAAWMTQQGYRHLLQDSAAND